MNEWFSELHPVIKAILIGLLVTLSMIAVSAFLIGGILLAKLVLGKVAAVIVGISIVMGSVISIVLIIIHYIGF